MIYSQELHRYQESRHRETLNRAEDAAKRSFWHGIAWATAAHWAFFIIVIAVYAPHLKNTIEYLGEVSAIHKAAYALPVYEGETP